MPSTNKFALLSVSDKTGLLDFASQLLNLGFTLLSTGGTQKLLDEGGLAVTGVSEHTGFAEIMDGRVKTLHPRIHGGILGRAQDEEVMQTQDIPPIDLVIVNLYPFEAATADGIKRASTTLKNITGAWVKDQKVTVKDGKITEYRVGLMVTFILKD